MAGYDTKTVTTLFATGSTSAVNNDNISAAGVDLANDTNAATFGIIELTVTMGTAPTDPIPTIDIYHALQFDGTNWSDAPVTGGSNQDLLTSIEVAATTGAQRVRSQPFLIPPEAVRPYADNQTGTTMTAGWGGRILYTNITG